MRFWQIVMFVFLGLQVVGCSQSKSGESSCQPNGTIMVQVERLYKHTQDSQNAGFSRFDVTTESGRKYVAARGEVIMRDGRRIEIPESNMLATDTSGNMRAIELDTQGGRILAHNHNPNTNIDRIDPASLMPARGDENSLLLNQVSQTFAVMSTDADQQTAFADLKKNLESASNGHARACSGSFSGAVFMNAEMPEYRAFASKATIQVFLK